jgi:hypothetical protein
MLDSKKCKPQGEGETMYQKSYPRDEEYRKEMNAPQRYFMKFVPEWFDEMNRSNEELIDMFDDNQQADNKEENHMILALLVVRCYREMWFMKNEIKRLEERLEAQQK